MDLIDRGLELKERAEPIANCRRQCHIGKIRPFLALGLAQKHHAIAPLDRRLRPEKLVDADAPDAIGKDARGILTRSDSTRSSRQCDGAEPAQAPSAQAERFLVESYLVAAFDAAGKARLDFVECHRP